MSLASTIADVRALMERLELTPVDRRSLEALIRYAERGTRASSTSMAAVSANLSSSQYFVQARSHLDRGLEELSRGAGAHARAEPEPPDDD